MKFKVKCIESKDPEFTEGKIYEWEDGEMKCNSGYTFDVLCESPNINKWKFVGVKFEMVEKVDECAITITEDELIEALAKIFAELSNSGIISTIESLAIGGMVTVKIVKELFEKGN